MLYLTAYTAVRKGAKNQAHPHSAHFETYALRKTKELRVEECFLAARNKPSVIEEISLQTADVW